MQKRILQVTLILQPAHYVAHKVKKIHVKSRQALETFLALKKENDIYFGFQVL